MCLTELWAVGFTEFWLTILVFWNPFSSNAWPALPWASTNYACTGDSAISNFFSLLRTGFLFVRMNNILPLPNRLSRFSAIWSPYTLITAFWTLALSIIQQNTVLRLIFQRIPTRLIVFAPSTNHQVGSFTLMLRKFFISFFVARWSFFSRANSFVNLCWSYIPCPIYAKLHQCPVFALISHWSELSSGHCPLRGLACSLALYLQRHCLWLYYSPSPNSPTDWAPLQRLLFSFRTWQFLVFSFSFCISMKTLWK